MDLTARQRAYLWLTILGYVVIGVTYMLATPPLESSDEYKHYPVVQYVQTRRALPVLEADDPGLWLQEAAQPPLYYLLMGLVTTGIDTSDLKEVHRVNPHAFVGNPNQIHNKNMVIHQPERDQFPGRGTVWAIYLARMASIGLGIGTLILTAQIGGLLFSSQVGLLAAALTAFNPMFLFVSAAVNNDSLAILLGSWGLYLLIRLWQDAPDPRSQWGRYTLIGLVLGLGMLTKLSLGGLLGLTGLALAWQTWRRRQWRWLLAGGLNVLAVALAVTGWWFIRNWHLYGDPAALNIFVLVQGVRDHSITWLEWIDEFGTFFRSYWGLFGGVNIAPPQPFYWICNALMLVGAVGMIRWARRTRQSTKTSIWLPLAWILILLILLIRWNLIHESFQGRLIFPGLAAINVLWANGLLAWLRPKWQPRIAVGVAGALLLIAAALPWTTIRPAYVHPVSLARVPADARFGPITFQARDGALQLVGVEMMPDQSITPGGDPVELALYWQVSQPVSGDYVSSIHLLGRQLRSEGQVDRYPAWGMVPTSRWQVGQIYRDEYHVYANKTAVAPAQLHIAVSIYDSEQARTLPATGPDGIPIELFLLSETARLAASEPPAVADHGLDIPFAEGITLAGYTLSSQKAVPGEEVTLTLYWQAAGTPSQAYTIFVHLVDSSQQQLAGADSPPVVNDYPTTLWREGDLVDDAHQLLLPLDLAPGPYQIRVGLYDPVSGRRLSRLDGAGDAVELMLEVGE